MNKDINRTLTALVPILRMNGETVKSIEAVRDWYKVGEREYLKEVAEITYDNGARKYADIDCASNLTAMYDVIAVIQQIKPRSSAIERIERGVYRQYPIENIPAAEVKPVVRSYWEKEPHGRLIDADALLRMEQEQYEATIADNPNPWHRTFFEAFHITFRDTIENAPTVVPEVMK